MSQDSAGGGGGPRHRFSSPSSFLAQYAGSSNTASSSDQEMDIILLDHGYAKPWSAHPDASNARPLRYLFKSKQPRGTADQVPRNVEDIDVEEVTQAPTLHFDVAKARTLMNECERHASFARPDDQQEDWEEKLSKAGWTVQQNRVFTRVMKALQADRLARLTVEGTPNEPIARRLVVDKTAKRLRQALASIAWDQKIVQWLHLLILDTMSVSILTSYLDALQTLKSKIPSLVERMTSGTTPAHPSLSSESLGLLLKRPWDPVGNTLSQQKPKKLPGNPLLLIAPSGPAQGGGGGGSPKDMKFWQSQLSGLGKVVPVTMHTVNGGSGVSVSLCLEHMIGAVRTKVLELKSHFPGRPIVLLGWNIGALVACHVSLVESVSAVVCLGFPLIGIHGLRGDVEDSLLDSKTPTLFVIGQDASDCSVDQMQDLREQMRAETGLVVVGGADEHLRLSHRQKKQEGLTQAMADRCIIFLGSILSLNASLPETVQEIPDVDLRKKRRRKTSRDGGSIALFQTPSATAREHAASTVRISKRGGKMSRQPAGSGLAFSTQGVYAQDHSRGSPRKRQGRGGIAGVPRKRLALSIGMNQLSVQVSSASPSFQTAAAARPAHPAALAAAVSSAPELSGLLQGIRVSRASVDTEQVTSAGKSFVSASLPLTRPGGGRQTDGRCRGERRVVFNLLLFAGNPGGKAGRRLGKRDPERRDHR
ncbi:hypothetical protein C0Q70_10313 [Pomacea canaliculata]|uniref:KANSL3 helical domain-containing protein n=1 Tax=Pomacea canaliculata TaxID=400727 RepID=A0A2T7PC95_POMCA|nr:hypothetical protein C0Q70_10313 [Pomacea canaliculata]